MLFIKGDSIVEIWRKTVISLFGTPDKGGEQWKDSVLVLELNNLRPLEYFDPQFPMTKENVDVINDFLITGNNEDAVIHDWTKLYRHRLVTETYDQIQQVIDYLKKKPQGMRAQLSVWNQEIDLYGKIGPCFQLAWFRINAENKLDIHVHMRACDAYGKLLMNINEFVSLQNYVATKVGVESGLYVQFVDSCHFGSENKDLVTALVDQLKKMPESAASNS